MTFDKTPLIIQIISPVAVLACSVLLGEGGTVSGAGFGLKMRCDAIALVVWCGEGRPRKCDGLLAPYDSRIGEVD
ncbi:hypothetical protein LFZ55_15385 [Salmonella enterica subsp. diarizonae serovar 65:c:z str. SA20044251]|nr:hypothetical protein LFZ55_15385 [Salmonella enterica subsp. diarizonae serovar 65:c:z str. SA20044251]